MYSDTELRELLREVDEGEENLEELPDGSGRYRTLKRYQSLTPEQKADLHWEGALTRNYTT